MRTLQTGLFEQKHAWLSAAQTSRGETALTAGPALPVRWQRVSAQAQAELCLFLLVPTRERPERAVAWSPAIAVAAAAPVAASPPASAAPWPDWLGTARHHELML